MLRNNAKRVALITLVSFALLSVPVVATVVAYRILGPVVVPRIEGEKVSSARIDLKDKGLILVVEDRVHSKEPEDYIIKQDPEPGKIVRKGQVVTVTISKGEAMVEVPSLVDKGRDSIFSVLDSVGLREGTIDTDYNESVEKDRVISQSPESGTLVKKNTKVDVVVSLGPKPKVATPAAPPKVVITKHDSHMIEWGVVRIVGEVKNVGIVEAHGVQIIATFYRYENNDEIIGTASGYAESITLAPGETSPFSFQYYIGYPKPDGRFNYKLESKCTATYGDPPEFEGD